MAAASGELPTPPGASGELPIPPGALGGLLVGSPRESCWSLRCLSG